MTLFRTRKGNAVELYFFPCQRDKKAMVIGGMHGSELTSIEVALSLIRKLSAVKNRIIVLWFFHQFSRIMYNGPETIRVIAFSITPAGIRTILHPIPTDKCSCLGTPLYRSIHLMLLAGRLKVRTIQF